MIKLSDLTCEKCIYGEKSDHLLEKNLVDCRRQDPQMKPVFYREVPTPADTEVWIESDIISILVSLDYWCGEGEWRWLRGENEGTMTRRIWFRYNKESLASADLMDPHENP